MQTTFCLRQKEDSSKTDFLFCFFPSAAIYCVTLPCLFAGCVSGLFAWRLFSLSLLETTPSPLKKSVFY